MIVSHRHRFVFVTTRKTAGSSIEAALSPLAGPDAVVTPSSKICPTISHGTGVAASTPSRSSSRTRELHPGP
jgi:hypothetical protein